MYTKTDVRDVPEWTRRALVKKTRGFSWEDAGSGAWTTYNPMDIVIAATHGVSDEEYWGCVHKNSLKDSLEYLDHK